MNETKLVWGRAVFFFFISQPYLPMYCHFQLRPDILCIMLYGRSIASHSDLLMLVYQYWQCDVFRLWRKGEQKDMRVSFHFEHWYVFLSFWLTWACQLSIFHRGCALCYCVDWNAAFSLNNSVFLIPFCPKITAAPYCMYYWIRRP